MLIRRGSVVAPCCGSCKGAKSDKHTFAER